MSIDLSSTALSVIDAAVLNRLDLLSDEYAAGFPFRHVVIPDFLDPAFCHALLAEFPKFDWLDGAPLAYLLAPDECNNDPTNYWIFSMPGLLRLVDRCGWNVVAQRTVGDTRSSNPSANDHDERAFLLLESRHPMPVNGA